MESVDGKVAVITGGGSGIGRSAALSLARRGATVLVSDLDASRPEAVRGEIEAAGGRAASACCDVTSDEDVAALADVVMSAMGRIDIVMSNVGVIAKGLPLEIPLDAWSATIDVNLLGTVRVLRTFLPPLLEQGSGHVVTTGSTAGLFPYAFDRLPYAATKAAVVMLSDIARAVSAPAWRRPDVLLPRGRDHQHRRTDPRVRSAQRRSSRRRSQ